MVFSRAFYQGEMEHLCHSLDNNRISGVTRAETNNQANEGDKENENGEDLGKSNFSDL